MRTACVWFVLCSCALAADWGQVGNGPQHTGYSPETLNAPFKLAWNVQFQPERLYPANQAVVADGRVFLGTEGGRLYCLKASDGSRLWAFPAGEERVGPILHAAGVEGGKVFFASMDGCLYAVDAATGKLVWRFESKLRTGFSTAVVLADGKVLAPNRGGTLFAVKQADGTPAWRADLGCPLLQTPAWNAGRVFIAGMDRRLRALDGASGKEVWRTDPMKGLAFKDYWPVVHRGLVVVRPMGPWAAAAFDEKTGKPVDLTIPGGITMNGAVAPPCVDAEGRLVTAMQNGWARVDIATKAIEYISERERRPGKPLGGAGNRDENMIATACRTTLFVLHCEEGNAQFTGTYDLASKRWTQLRGGPWRNLTSNTQGGGAGQASIADGRVYHVSMHGLRCFVEGK